MTKKDERTNEELLNSIRKYAKDKKRIPVANDFVNNPKYPSLWTYQTRFGCWNNALKMAGLLNLFTNCEDEELLEYLIQFYEENGRSPTEKDFSNNNEYPSYQIYQKRFGSWSSALKRVGLDIETMVKNGIIETNRQKARLAEILVRDHFKKHPIDLAGENQNSPCDGICPNGLSYDVKSSSFDGRRYVFRSANAHKDKIEIIYLLAFNTDHSRLMYVWRVPMWKFIDKDAISIGLKSNYEHNIENMREYDVTDKFKDILKKFTIKSKGIHGLR